MKVFNIIKNIILDLIIVFLLVIVIFSFINRGKPTPILGHYLFTVMSGSMQDALKVGDSIIVRESNDYSVGDIITYKGDNMYVTHRLVKIDGNMVTTKGDANDQEDPAFDKELILGKVVYKSGFLNFIVKYKVMIVLFFVIIYLISLLLKNDKKVTNNET